MIEQIVDENGTLKHIVLSALGDGNESCSDTNSSNYMPPTLSFLPFYSCGCYESISSSYPSSSAITPSQSSQPQQQAVAHTSGVNVQGASINANTLVSMASQSIPCSLFPTTYVRQRRTNRNFNTTAPAGSKKIPSPYGLSQPSHGNNNTAAWNNKLGQATGGTATTTTASTGATPSRHRSNELSNKAGGSRYEVSRGHYEALPPMFELRNEGNYYLTKLNETFNLAMKKPGAIHSATAPTPLQFPQQTHHHQEQLDTENVKIFKNETFLLDPKKYENYVKKACSLGHTINSYCLKCQHKTNENSVVMIDNEMITHKSSDKNRGGEGKRPALIDKTGREDVGRKGNKKREAKQTSNSATSKSVSISLFQRNVKDSCGLNRSKRRSLSSNNDSKPSSISEQTGDPSGDDHQTDGSSPETVPLVVENVKNVVRNGVIKPIVNGMIIRDNNKVIEHVEAKVNNKTKTIFAEVKENVKVEDKKPKEKPKEHKEEKIEIEEKHEKEEEEEQESDDISDPDEHEKEEESDDHAATRRAYKHSTLPKIEAIVVLSTSVSFNYVRLRWQLKRTITEVNDEKRNFIVDMLLPNQAGATTKDGEYESRIVYQGCNMSCRVSHLRPQSNYTFRVRTITSDAVLVSNLLELATSADQSSNTNSKQFGRKSKQQLQQQVLQQQQQILAQQVLLRQQQSHGQRRSNAGEDQSNDNEIEINQDSIWSSIQRSEKQCAILIIFFFTLAAVFGPAAYHFLVN